jgi:Domain of unknown function (DUF397)
MTEDLHREPESGGQADRLAGAVWRKSTKSGTNGNCVEVADLGEYIAVRDSKDKGGPKLVFSREVWSSFIGNLRAEGQIP